MIEYVKRNDLGLTDFEIVMCDGDYKEALKMLLDKIEKAPAADVAPVKHGSWHKYSKGSGSYNGVIVLSDAFQCTICKESFWNKSNYCPSCGAKMDGGWDDGE